MATVIESVQKLQTKQSGERQSAYHKLVRVIAEGEEVAPEQVIEVLERAGRDAETLQRDVAIVERRKRLAATLAERPQIQKRIAEITKASDENKQKLRAFTAECHRRGDELRKESDSLHRQIAELDRNEIQLQRSMESSNPQWLRRYKAACERHSEIAGRLRKLEFEIDGSGQGSLRTRTEGARRKVADEELRQGNHHPRGNPENLRRATIQLDTLSGQLAEKEAELAKVKQEFAKSECELAKLHEEALIP